MAKRCLFIILLCLILLPLISAELEVGITDANGEGEIGINFEPIIPSFDNDTASVNVSQFTEILITDQGNIDNINSTWFEVVVEVLTLKTSQLASWIDDGWLKLDGSNANQNISISPYSLDASWFKGKFNWTSGDSWNSFDGSTLLYNDSRLRNEFYNKTEVNNLVGALSLSLFFHNDLSPLYPNTFIMNQSTNGPESGFSFTISADETPLGNFTSQNMSELGISGLTTGVYDGHFHGNATQAGKKDVYGYYRLYIYYGNGSITFLGESEHTLVDSLIATAYDSHMILEGDKSLSDNDRLVLSLFADIEGGGGDPDLGFQIDGETGSRFQFSVTGVSFATQTDLLKYLKHDGSVAWTGNENGTGQNSTFDNFFGTCNGDWNGSVDYFKHDGSVTATGDFNLGDYGINNLAFINGTDGEWNITKDGTGEFMKVTVDLLTLNGASIISDLDLVSFIDNDVTTTGDGTFGNLIANSDITSYGELFLPTTGKIHGEDRDTTWQTTDLVTNGGFTGNDNGWSKSGGGFWSYSSNNERFYTDSSGTENLSQTISVSAGNTYNLSWSLTLSGGGGEDEEFRVWFCGNKVYEIISSSPPEGDYSYSVDCLDTSDLIFEGDGGSDFLITDLDDVSVFELNQSAGNYVELEQYGLANAWKIKSDRSFKEKISEVYSSAKSIVSKWIPKNSKNRDFDYGFLAEDVRDECKTLDENDFYIIDYSCIFSFKIVDLENEIEDLEQENEALKDELCLKDNTYSWCPKL